jgi:sulfide dehydrogenase cytochrome subunit
MRTKTFFLATLAVAVTVSCSTAEKVVDKASKTVSSAASKAFSDEKPGVQTGASGVMLASTCAGCHGTNGASKGPATPSIAGLEEEYFVGVMNAYKSGERWSTIMGRIAKGYSDEDIAAIAKHYSQMPFKPTLKQTAANDTGAQLHEEYCEKCHEDGATSSEDIVLAGQLTPYMNWTMWDYANGVNKIPEKKMAKAFEEMRAAHGDKSITDLVGFYGSRSK